MIRQILEMIQTFYNNLTQQTSPPPRQMDNSFDDSEKKPTKKEPLIVKEEQDILQQSLQESGEPEVKPIKKRVEVIHSQGQIPSTGLIGYDEGQNAFVVRYSKQEYQRHMTKQEAQLSLRTEIKQMWDTEKMGREKRKKKERQLMDTFGKEKGFATPGQSAFKNLLNTFAAVRQSQDMELQILKEAQQQQLDLIARIMEKNTSVWQSFRQELEDFSYNHSI